MRAADRPPGVRCSRPISTASTRNPETQRWTRKFVSSSKLTKPLYRPGRKAMHCDRYEHQCDPMSNSPTTAIGG